MLQNVSEGNRIISAYIKKLDSATMKLYSSVNWKKKLSPKLAEGNISDRNKETTKKNGKISN